MGDVLLLVTLFICLLTDLKKRKIYNIVLFPAVIGGILLNIYDTGFTGLLFSIKGFFIGLGFLLLPFIWGGIGAGDVKLLATIGAIKGPEFIFYTCLGMGFAGGIIAMVILLFQGRLFQTLGELWNGLIVLFTTQFKVVSFGFKSDNNMFPYGIAITLGAISAYFVG
ncbi:MAG: A24 family peptidase [Bacillota bacterium]